METWQIRDAEVTFDEDTHSYTVNGEKCISVTQLLKFKFPNKYKGVSERVLREKAAVGTELHEAIEVYEEYGLQRDDLLEFRNYLFLKDKFNWTTVECEVPVVIVHNDIQVCGRLDQVQQCGDELGLADIKHTASLDKEYLAYQLNLYRIGYQACYGQRIDFLKGIHLNGDKRKYVDIPINEKAVIELLEEYAEVCN